MATISSRHVHDCDDCTFHGLLGEYDVYHHNDTVILRYGDDGPEYLSNDISLIESQQTGSLWSTAMWMVALSPNGVES